MTGEAIEADPIAARKAYLREQEREKKRRQRARKRAAKIAHDAGLSVPALSPGDAGQAGEDKPEIGADPPRPVGRPKTWDAAKALKWQDFICQRIREGKTLTAICRAHKQGPSLDTVYRWLGDSATFQVAYERAKIDAADSLFWQAIDIADSASGDAPAISAARMRSDVRKYAAAKLRPERYAERAEVHATGEVKHVISDDQRARALAAFIARQAIGQAQSLPDVRRLIEQKTEKTEPKP